ncbi:Bone morphogenetic protein 3B [Fasciolopsis buskii]|uniref:Bone morphogenetic protein 3B n=1 Tax=Fasciolopsis buskii TaxID=27845 RepID=A0A8E0VIN6_9TREM|nr:Bone morphogenetic protein 3B [Fasciolopsis buski]
MGSLGHRYAPYILLYLRQAKNSGDFDDLFKSIPFSSDFSHFRNRQSLGISSPEINSWHSNFPRSRRKTVANLTLVHMATENQTRLKRVRRQAKYRDIVRRSAFSRSRSHRMCSMQSMFVDFAQIGWNRWIISPTHYDARMCTGQCPFPLGQAFHPSNHAVVQMLMHHLNPSPTGPGTVRIHRPCCVPQKLAALHVLYHDQNNQVILKVYDDMIVESCGCR